jgi:hypothetical protein
MVCYECFMRGQRRDAIGLCHHCSVAVCAEHAEVVAVPITEKVLLAWISMTRIHLRSDGLLCRARVGL